MKRAPWYLRILFEVACWLTRAGMRLHGFVMRRLLADYPHLKEFGDPGTPGW